MAVGVDPAALPGFQWPADRPGEAAPPPPPPPAARGSGPAPVRVAVAVAGAAAAVLVYFLPLEVGLSPQARAACAVFLVCTTLWITDLIPIGVTGLLAVALLGLTGGMSSADAYAAFGNSAVFFILGVFILAAATIHSGLSKRIALWFLGRCQGSAGSLAAGLMLAAALLTVWMPNQATAAMLFPIAVELGRAMGLAPRESRYGKLLFLSMAWGAMVGSNASFLGSTRAPLALGILQRTTGETISLADWMLAAAPLVVVGLVTGLLLLRALFPPEPVDLEAARRMIRDSAAELGPMTPLQRRVAAVVLLTVGAWVLLGSRVDLAAMALLGAVLLFATGALRWGDLEGYVHWGIILMYGGAIALGQALESSGAAAWLAAHLVPEGGVPLALAVVGLVGAAVLLTEFMSNAAAIAVVLPLGLGLSAQLGLEPTAVVLLCSLAAGLDFTFPFSSAPNAIAYAGGYLGLRDMVLAGGIMTLLQVLTLLLLAGTYWRWIGVL